MTPNIPPTNLWRWVGAETSLLITVEDVHQSIVDPLWTGSPDIQRTRRVEEINNGGKASEANQGGNGDLSQKTILDF